MTRSFTAILLASSALMPAAARAEQLPTGSSVAAGQVAIATPGSGRMVITQGSDKAIVNWQGFSIGAGNRVDIQQPDAKSVLLNRVTGDASSTIAGTLNANGQVFLVNPNGIFITATGSVNAAGFVASTLDIADEDFLEGDIVVTGRGGSVANAGRISIVKGGYAALIGGNVDNAGLIAAPLGKVALGSGTRATLDLAGDGFLQVALPSAAEGGIAMSGRISADGGSVLLTAASAVAAARQTINLTGLIEARGVEGRNGAVTLTAGHIELAGATIDVSGAAGGGTVRIGGDRMGLGALAHAQTLDVDAASSIRADATESGDGGDIVLWSDKATRFAGTISARGAGGGSGGDAEVSSAGQLDYRGHADLRGARFGTLLLDPYNITITNAPDGNHSGFTANGNDSVLNIGTLTSALATANVTVSTGSAGSQAGNITLAAPLAWSTATTLTLNAAGAIALNAPITAAAGGLTIDAGSTISASGAIDLGRFTLTRGNWVQNDAALPSFRAGDFRVASTGATFLRALGGMGGAADPWRLADIYGVQGMGSLLSGHFSLANDIDAQGTLGWNDGKGFVPIGTNANRFTGSLEGADHVLSGLFLNYGSGFGHGLFGVIGTGATVARIGLTDVHISGGGAVGALVGTNYGTITQAHVTGDVAGFTAAGGLVGRNYGTIEQSFSNATVTGKGSTSSNLGGFVGENYGTIRDAYATGSVSGYIYSGGFAGRNDSSISRVYATGLVSSGNAGGLIGFSAPQSALSGSFWDVETTGQARSRGSSSFDGGARGLTTFAFQDTATFVPLARALGWDFQTLWAPPSNGYYPVFYRDTHVVAVTPDSFSRIYGDANPALTVNYYGLRAGDVMASGATLSTMADASSNVGAYLINATGGAATSLGGSAYRIVHMPGTLTVAPRPLNITANASLRVYGDANPTFTYIIGGMGLINGDTLTGRLATSANVMSDVGNYAITLGSLGAANYAITFTGANMLVTHRAISVAADPLNRVYGDANPALTYAIGGMGLVNGDTLSGGLATNAIATSNIGIYAISQGDLAASSNYALTFNGGNLAITPRAISVAADPLSRIYGDANPALTYTIGDMGLVNGDTLSGALATVASATSNIGSYAITRGDLAASSNYVLSFTGADLTVAPRAISITADPLSRIYGDANPALTYTLGGMDFVNGDTLSGALTTYAATTSNVGSYTITQGSLAASSNYALSFTGANLVITPRAISVTADALSRIYGDANPALTYAVGGLGLVNGDALSGALATGAAVTSGVGSYAITQGNLAASSNYALSFTGANLIITPRAISVTADALSRIYGNANPALTYSVGGLGLVNGDTLAGALGTNVTVTSDVGSYAITQGTLGSANYAVTFTGANLAITPRALSITADPLSRIYGNANPTLTYTVGDMGLVNGDTLSGALTTVAAATSSVGSYTITQGDLAASSNYALSFTGADLTVTPRALSITADALNRIYGDANPALTYTMGGLGLVNGDTLSGALATGATVTSNVGSHAITQGNLAASSNYAVEFSGANLVIIPRAISVTADALSRIYGNANPALAYTLGGLGLVNGDALSGTLATDAVTTSDVGAYAIAQGSLAASPNYALTYTGANLTVTPRVLSVTADTLSRIYGDANPMLSYTAQGLINGDILAGALATNATAASHVGSYAITQGSLAASSNYVLSFSGANLAVTPRAITVTADNLTRVVGFPNPPLTYVVGGLGLANGDALSGGLVTGASNMPSQPAAPGRYSIEQGTLAGSPNYSLTFVPGALLVTVPLGLGSYASTFDRDGNFQLEATGKVHQSGLEKANEMMRQMMEAMERFRNENMRKEITPTK